MILLYHIIKMKENKMGKINITIDDWVQREIEKPDVGNKSVRYQELLIKGLQKEEIDRICGETRKAAEVEA